MPHAKSLSLTQAQKLTLAQGMWLGLVLGCFAALSPPAFSQQPKPDNIYHEGKPDNADVFPRLGKTEGLSSERNNCRVAPWGKVATALPGGVFVEINRRMVDRWGDSWFRVADLNCWLHDSRIDLL